MTRRRTLGLAAVACTLIVPAVALAAVVQVRGTRGNDTLCIQPESASSARIVFNGATIGSASRGDTVEARTGAGNDFACMDEEDFPPNYGLDASLGSGRDRLSYVVSAGSDLLPVRADGGTGGDRLSIRANPISDTPPEQDPGYDIVARGRTGNDQIAVSGFPGRSLRADGGSGNDRLSFTVDIATNPIEHTAVAARGGPGRDRLTLTDALGNTSTAGTVTSLRGGDGDDRLTALAQQSDRLYGDRGDDVLRAPGGGRDAIRCGRGDDTVFADGSDTVSSDCEKVRRS
jgi:hypothetical protein